MRLNRHALHGSVCQWPECVKQIPHDVWGCKLHLNQLPHKMRSKLQSLFPKRNMNDDAEKDYQVAVREFKAWHAGNFTNTPVNPLCDEVLNTLQDRYRFILNRTVTPLQWVDDRYRKDSISLEDSARYLKENHGIKVSLEHLSI